MRRKDREVSGDIAIKEIIEQCSTCYIGFMDDKNPTLPYVIPLSFGYQLNSGILELYFHCASVGKKINCIVKNPNVSFCICVENRIEIHKENLCKSGRFYASVCGHGIAEIITDDSEKCKALTLLMERQSGIKNQGQFNFTKEQADKVTIIKITSQNFTGKAKKPHPT